MNIIRQTEELMLELEGEIKNDVANKLYKCFPDMKITKDSANTITNFVFDIITNHTFFKEWKDYESNI